MKRVEIFDTTLRDAEQIPGATLNVEQKLEVARQLARLNVDIIEAGFPISSPGDLEAVQRIAREVSGPRIAGLARVIRKDIDAAWEAVRDAEKPRIHTFVGTSDVHVESILRKTRPEVLQMAIDAVRYAKEKTEDIEFSPMDATRTDFDYLCEVVEKTIEAGATVVNIPDTVGYTIPSVFGELIARLREAVPNIEQCKISVHCHNDLGLATANSLAGVQNGAIQIECAMNGLGERAGNAAVEEVVMAVRTRKDVFDADTGVNAKEIARTSRMVSSLMGIPVQPNKAIVGSNAFAHSSGIHQDGILKSRATFEIIRPEDVGITEHRLVLTARSGRHALRHRLEILGYDLTEQNFDEIYERFIAVADKKKEVTDEDLEAIVGEQIAAVPEAYHLVAMRAVADTEATPSARVRVTCGDAEHEAEATGDGPVDALFRAIDQATGWHLRLTDYAVRSITSGREAMGEVTVHAEVKETVLIGRAAATDIIEASARAYLNAINRAVAADVRP